VKVRGRRDGTREVNEKKIEEVWGENQASVEISPIAEETKGRGKLKKNIKERKRGLSSTVEMSGCFWE